MDTFENYLDIIAAADELIQYQEYEETPTSIIDYNTDVVSRLDTIIENQHIADNHNLINTPLIVILTFMIIIALVVKFIKNLF